MKRLFFIIPCLALAATVARADGPEPQFPVDSRMKLLMYDETDIYTIPTKYGYQTNIVFGPREEIQTISVGDRSLWQIIPAKHILFLRPQQENVSTNMTVMTNLHTYQFDLKSVGEEKNTSIIYVAKFVYPDDMPKAPEPASMPASADAAHPNYSYTYGGPDALAPSQVYDNGRSTFIRYHILPSPLPVVTAIDNGSERPAPYFAQGDTLVVDTVAEKLSLKADAGTVTVYNELLSPR